MSIPAPTDTAPWYRHFWLWFIMVLPATVVVAALTTVYIASRHADDMVAVDYYKDGLAINQQLAKKQRAIDLAIRASLQFSQHSVMVRTHGQLRATQLSLQLFHPLEADRDMQITLTRMEAGVYAGVLDQPAAANWYWSLELLQKSPWRLDGVLAAENFDPVNGL